MTIPQPVIGVGALLIGLLLTFILPPGRRGRYALLGSIAVFALWVMAAFYLWPLDPRNGWNWVLPGVIAGAVAVVIRDIRRWARYFQNLSYRVRHPYYWYSRFRASRRRRR